MAQPCGVPAHLTAHPWAMYCRYHLLKPEYIHHRIKELQRSFRLRLILCHVDTDDAVEPLAQVRGQGRGLPASPSAGAAD